MAVVKYMQHHDIRFENTEVWVVLTGSEEAGLRGAKAFCKAHKDELGDVETVFVGLDTIRDYDFMAIYSRDLTGTVKNDESACALVKEAAKQNGLDMPYKSVFFGATDAAGRKLAAVVLVPDAGLRTLEARSRMVWIAGSLVFLAAMLLLSTYLSRRFVTPISRSLQAIREQTPGEHPSGISEIDELLAFVRSRAAEQLTAGGLPPNIEELLSGFRDRVQTLTPMERTVLQYYIDGCSLEEVAARAYISVATAKKHNTNINRKLGVTSREELMLYIDLFRRCGRLDEIAAPRAEDTARCTT